MTSSTRLGTEVLAHRLRVIIEGRRQLPAAAEPPIERHGHLHPAILHGARPWREHDLGLTITEYKPGPAGVAHGQPQTYEPSTRRTEGFVAGSGDRGYNANVRSLLKRIRRKFLAVDPGFSEIENLPTVGYRWRSQL